MRAATLICCFAACAAVLCPAQVNPELKSLYDSRDWKALSARLEHATGMPLYRGAVGVTFNQDPDRTEHLLLSLIAADPNSPEAYDASEWLSHLYLYRGQYRSLVSIMDKRWAAFPDKKEKSQEQAAVTGFRGLPDQVLESTRPSKLTHEPGSIFIPLSINGNSATYFFDTGAWVSCMSESEAKRLHLQIRNSSGSMGQIAGAQVGFRTAVAQDVVIGNTRFKDVSFAVFPDNQEPWSDLQPGRRGIIGIPLLVGIQTINWEKDGVAELSYQPEPFNIQRSNLSFDNEIRLHNPTATQNSDRRNRHHSLSRSCALKINRGRMLYWQLRFGFIQASSRSKNRFQCDDAATPSSRQSTLTPQRALRGLVPEMFAEAGSPEESEPKQGQ
jgi:hypothetical protein